MRNQRHVVIARQRDAGTAPVVWVSLHHKTAKLLRDAGDCDRQHRVIDIGINDLRSGVSVPSWDAGCPTVAVCTSLVTHSLVTATVSLSVNRGR